MKKHGTNIGFGMNASKYLCENLCLFNNVCVKNGFVVNKISIYLEESKYLLKNNSTITPFAKNSSPKEILKRNKEQALAICEQGIQLYPHYSRIGIL